MSPRNKMIDAHGVTLKEDHMETSIVLTKIKTSRKKMYVKKSPGRLNRGESFSRALA